MKNTEIAQRLVLIAKAIVVEPQELTAARNLPKDRAAIRNMLRGIITKARQLDDLANDFVKEDNAQEAIKAVKAVKTAIGKLDDIIK